MPERNTILTFLSLPFFHSRKSRETQTIDRTRRSLNLLLIHMSWSPKDVGPVIAV